MTSQPEASSRHESAKSTTALSPRTDVGRCPEDRGSLAYDAVLLLGFGGPESEPEVLPFLRRVTAGRGIPTERLREVGEHYFALGGVSPINQQNRDLLAALTRALIGDGVEAPIRLANRNSPPFLPDVLAELAAAGRRRILAVATAAYPGYSACRQYREDLAQAQHETGLDVRLAKLPPFYDLPEFAAAIARLAVDAFPDDLVWHAPTTRLVFTTHSIPIMAGGRPLTGGAGEDGDAPPGGAYLVAHRRVAASVSAEIERLTGHPKDWQLVFQSRSGPPSMPWLEPDVNAALVEIAATGARDVVLAPIGFLSDHMEVVWDLDTQAQKTATECGLRLVRTPTVGVDQEFVDAFAELIASELRTGSAPAGPGQFCYGDCCADPRRPKPASVGLAPLERPSEA